MLLLPMLRIATIFRLNVALAVLALGFSAVPQAALADLTVRFIEGAPKDRFVFKNVGACAISDARLELDLSQSASGLIFDVTSAGAGVEVFQPLEIVAGREALKRVPNVRDGDNKVRFEIARLAPGATLSFTIDVDDTMGGREITVSNSEFTGSTVRLSAATGAAEAMFGAQPQLTVDFKPCA